VVIFWGVVMGGIAIIMLLVGEDGEALTGIQNITIIMAAPFALVMVLLCVALTKDLRNDPLMRRDVRSQEAVVQAVEYGQKNYGDGFHLSVKKLKD
jgi:choline-glycine betaine transporter